MNGFQLAGLTDGKYFITIRGTFLYIREALANALELKEELIQIFALQQSVLQRVLFLIGN